ncbi:MAG: T9SS type A sorting domain-containing protein [Bacteroidetes bacterium]|nr:T9SS type A sorting domain-containing protein [Bacteroidota bacterium]
MKNIIYFIILLVFSAKTSAQSAFNRSYHDQNEASNSLLVEIFGDLYFTTNLNEAYKVGKCYIYKHNNGGVLKFRSNILGYRIPEIAYKTIDNNLLITGRNSICDVLGPTQVNFIAKIDSTAGFVFFSTYTVSPWDSYKASLQYSDSSYFSFTDSVLFKHSKTGQFISKTNLGLKNISACILLPNNNILLSAKQAIVNSLIEISPTGATVNMTTFPALLKKMTFYNGQKIIGLGTNGILYKTSTSYNYTGNSSSALSVKDYASKNDSLFIIASSPERYMISDTAFNTSYTSTTTTQQITQRSICLNGNKVAILSDSKATTGFVGWGQHTFVSLNEINKFSSNNFSSDVAVISVTADSSYSQCPFPNYCSSYLRAKIKVRNKGNTQINSFKLNCYMYPQIDCGSNFYQEQFSGLALMPGDSITVTTNTFVQKTISSPSNPNVTYCFYSSVPNGETDKNFSDNEICAPFNFPTGVNEIPILNSQPILSPNPFDNVLKITSNDEIKTIEIFNSTGQFLKKYLINDKTAVLTELRMPQGIYILRISTNEKEIIKKVVKN